MSTSTPTPITSISTSTSISTEESIATNTGISTEASISTKTVVAPHSPPSLKEMAGAAKANRNRAIDLYRALAMVAVAVGHWMAMAIGIDEHGELFAGNALELAPRMAWASWIFQVMPLFFVVGGFSSAMSLDSFTRNDEGRPQDWVIARLRRMLAPAMVLAATWAALIAGGFVMGQGELIAVGATAAAIPLWFLANYTIDTAIAPYVLPMFRRHPVAVPTLGLTVFFGLEVARLAGVPALPQLNWILGWLLFQIAGFAWRDGLLSTGRNLMLIASGLWAAAVAIVAFGPYPVSMVHFPGLIDSPTHPPTPALLLFGAAYSATAIAIAPAVSRWLAARPKAWAAVVASNAVAMSVYLWHFTAAIAASAIFYALGWLPTAQVGTFDWWIQKMPLLGVAAIILALMVAKVSPVEQKALLAPRSPWVAGPLSMFALTAVLSTALKQWAHGDFTVAATCIGILLVLWHGVVRTNSILCD